jgi:hypothetical protein
LYRARVGDTFEVVVDVEATLGEAPELAEAVLHWLVAEGVVEAAQSDAALGTDLSHRPGPKHRIAVRDTDHGYDIAGLRTNGLGIEIGRTVFYPIQGEPGPAVCPLCSHVVVLVDPVTRRDTPDLELFIDAVGDWYDGGDGTVLCPNCGSAITINEWQWLGDWPIVVGNLGFKFWNWPLLHPNLVRAIGDRLGHRVVVTRGKL